MVVAESSYTDLFCSLRKTQSACYSTAKKLLGSLRSAQSVLHCLFLSSGLPGEREKSLLKLLAFGFGSLKMEEGGGKKEQRSALDGRHVEYTLYPPDGVSYDMELTMSSLFPSVVKMLKVIKRGQRKNRAFKVQIRVQATLEKFSFEQDRFIRVTQWFISESLPILTQNQIEPVVAECLKVILANFDSFVHQGSGWTLEKVNEFSVLVMKYKLFAGGCGGVSLPAKLVSSRSLIPVSVKGKKNNCFLHSVAAALVGARCESNSSRYDRLHRKLLSCLPARFGCSKVGPKDVSEFEKKTPVSVNIYSFEKGVVFPVRVSNARDRSMSVDLLLYRNHYFSIKNLPRLVVGSQRASERKTYVCHHCLSYFARKSCFDLHVSLCTKKCQQLKFPSQEAAFVKFDNFSSLAPAPFVIYVDFETMISEEVPVAKGKIEAKKRHIPIACASYTVCCVNDDFTSDPFVYVGLDCVEKLMSHLQCQYFEIQSTISLVNRRMKPMTIDEQLSFDSASHCFMCGLSFKWFPREKVCDHCHLTGSYRFALCNRCNLVYAKPSDKVFVFVHGLSNYDSHFLVHHLHKYPHLKTQVIPKNTERFILLRLGSLVFKDSYLHMGASLATLVTNLRSKGEGCFYHVNKHVKDSKARELLYRKGVFPYNYLKSVEVLWDKGLPPKECFRDDISKRDITDDDYKFARSVWEAFHCQTFCDYLRVYLLADCLLLADCFENFRLTCIQNYALDPAYYFSNAHLSFPAFLRFSSLTLELISDVNMYLFFQSAIRGGLSICSHRFAKANNKYMASFDPNVPSSYILDLDCNNLYGRAMMCYLPFADFHWVSISTLNVEKEILQLGEDSDWGFILEVSLKYPSRLHEEHSDFPLAPFHRSVSYEELSPYARFICDSFHLKSSCGIRKLTSTVEDRCCYILHYRNFQLYLSLGMELVKVHRAIKFRQAPIMKGYVEFNSKCRSQATNKFDQDFYKLMVNALFGKTIERPDKRSIVKLITNAGSYEREVSKMTFKGAKIIHKNLVSTESRHPILKIEKPFYLGVCILDLAKYFMYDFFYNVLKKFYPSKDQLRLMYQDTDSFFLHIATPDVYSDFQSPCLNDFMDFSNYPSHHPLYSTSNSKVPGLFKDECKGNAITRFVGLRSKMYAFQQEKVESDIKIAKGVPKQVIARDLKFSTYLQCLSERKQVENSYSTIRSFAHDVYTIRQSKISLSPFDDKRYICEDGISTLPYGHQKCC